MPGGRAERIAKSREGANDVTNEIPATPGKGHPKGLYPLFFTEMWERLAFYLMLGILVLYATDTERGGLGLSTSLATEIFGSYLALVYFTPFLGGMIADRFLGYRVSVLIGGLCMAAGLFTLSVWGLSTLLIGLALLCIGNGLFKPNISAMVGNLYAPGDPKRDAGFNIFYMGINTGALLSALISAPLRNKLSFNAAFFGAGVGLCIGVLILLISWKRLARADRKPEIDSRDASFGQIMLTIIAPALAFGFGGWWIGERLALIESTIGSITFGFLTGMIPVIFYFITLIVRAGPEERPGLAALMPVYVAGGAFFMVLHLSGGLMTIFTEHNASRRADAWVPEFVQTYFTQKAMPSYFANAEGALPRPHENTLVTTTDKFEAMFGAKRITEETVSTILERNSDIKAMDTQAEGKEIADKWGFLVCKVFANDVVSVTKEKDSHGVETISVKLEPETAKAERNVIFVREAAGETFPILLVTQETFDSVYTKASDARFEKGEFANLYNAELITSLLNPLFVVMLTPVVVAFFNWRVSAGKPISTARKILYGMLITVAATAIVATAAKMGNDGADKVALTWLVSYYLVITVGELCLSPMGLSLVTKLAPKRLVGMMMGGWFLASAIGNKLSGFLSGLEPTALMFTLLTIALLGIAFILLLLQPMLNRAIQKYGA